MRLASMPHAARLAAHQAHGPLAILESGLRILHAARHAVFEDDARHADGAAPLGDVFAFHVEGKKPIRAARRNDERCARVFVLVGPVNH